MHKITTAAAVARLKRAGWSDFKFKNDGVTMRHLRTTRHMPYVDELGTMVDAQRVVILEREMRLRDVR